MRTHTTTGEVQYVCVSHSSARRALHGENEPTMGERERAKWTRKIAKAIAKRHFLECIWLVFHQNGIVSRRATTYDRRTNRLRCYLNNFISDSRFRLRTSFVNEIKFIYLPCEYHHRIAFARININQPVKSIFKLNFKTFFDQKKRKNKPCRFPSELKFRVSVSCEFWTKRAGHSQITSSTKLVVNESATVIRTAGVVNVN